MSKELVNETIEDSTNPSLDFKNFKIGSKVVYASHGVGEIVAIETEVISGFELKVYVISFIQDKMTLRVPISRAQSSGLRPLVDKTDVEKVFAILVGKPKQGNRMWSRRAQEYEAKINSGDLASVAEVVRDLYKNADSDRSYSERTIYESALNRLASEISVLENISKDEAVTKLLQVLKQKIAA
ncbi:MAG: CarD family transcriptional regulator [Rickettsiaceae bacterium]|nr:CarD family transcriptional regulator [Rickettsiaceae bacterium]